MKKQRPMNLNLFKLTFPHTAIVSILHRISGVVLFLCVPILLYFLQQSLTSQAHFLRVSQILSTVGGRLLMLGIVAAVIYHLLAGIRHIIMDFGLAESLKASRCTATLVLVLAVVCIILAGVWLW